MEAQVLRDGEILLVYLSGQLTYEVISPFRHTCLTHLYKEKVVFNCEKLSFVGSKGITDFIETMELLSLKTLEGVRFCKLGTEFRRLLETSGFKNLSVYEDEAPAKASFYQPLQGLPALIKKGEVSSPAYEGEEELS